MKDNEKSPERFKDRFVRRQKAAMQAIRQHRRRLNMGIGIVFVLVALGMMARGYV